MRRPIATFFAVRYRVLFDSTVAQVVTEPRPRARFAFPFRGSRPKSRCGFLIAFCPEAAHWDSLSRQDTIENRRDIFAQAVSTRQSMRIFQMAVLSRTVRAIARRREHRAG